MKIPASLLSRSWLPVLWLRLTTDTFTARIRCEPFWVCRDAASKRPEMLQGTWDTKAGQKSDPKRFCRRVGRGALVWSSTQTPVSPAEPQQGPRLRNPLAYNDDYFNAKLIYHTQGTKLQIWLHRNIPRHWNLDFEIILLFIFFWIAPHTSLLIFPLCQLHKYISQQE